ncbi:MAG: DUF5979 domain-containing protein [Eubacteriales bacterium]|nr:DUF5979 domain-containing protein [Eubacteriales bacterium]MDD4512965.1 DUF5979 domain-containing protein [Eubacteriales bacterium]
MRYFTSIGKALKLISVLLLASLLLLALPFSSARAVGLDDALASMIWDIVDPSIGSPWEQELKQVFVDATGITSSTATDGIKWFPDNQMTDVVRSWGGSALNVTSTLPDTHTPGQAELVATTVSTSATSETTYTSYTASNVPTVELVVKRSTVLPLNPATDEYHVYTGEALRYVMNCFNANVKGNLYLEKSIDLNGRFYDWGTARLVQGQGFYGQGHTIYNLRAAEFEPSTSRVGFITTGDSGITVNNVAFQTGYLCNRSPSTNTVARTGLIAVLGTGAFDIRDMRATNMTVVSGTENAAVLIGRSNDGTVTTARDVTRCFVTNSKVFGTNHVASLSSCMFKVDYDRCFSTGCTVISTGTHSGGLVSCGNTVDFTNCFTDVSLYGSVDTGVFIGLVDGDENSFTGCYATGFIDGSNSIGGFIGTISDGSCPIAFNQCYSTALVGLRKGGRSMGGFVGRFKSRSNPTVTLNECYAAGEVGSTDTDLSGDPATDEQSQLCGGFIGDCNLNAPPAQPSLTLTECYYDKQTTAMREWSTGRRQNTAGLVGAPVGVLTTDTVKAGNGLLSTSFAFGHGFQRFSTASAWDYSVPEHYPELSVFKNAQTADWGSQRIANHVIAYSLASTCGVQLDTWEHGLDVATGKIGTSGEALDPKVYCTVRDLTSGFNLTDYEVVLWERVGNEESNVALPSKVTILGEVYDVLSLKNQNGSWMCDSLVPGIEWLRVTCEAGTGSDKMTATSRLRVIPTASIEAGKSAVVVYKYDHADDVELLFSNAARLAVNMADITTGPYPDVEGQANPLTTRQNTLIANRRMPPYTSFNAGNDQYAYVDTNYMSTSPSDNAQDSELYVYAYEITGFGPDNEILYDDNSFIPLVTPLSKSGTPTAFGMQLNGYDAFGDYNQRYLIIYYWRLSDKRVLQDSKIIRRASVPFHLDLNLYYNVIAAANLYPTGGYLYTGVDRTSTPILSDFSAFETAAQQAATVSGLADYKQHAQAAWKIKDSTETITSVTLTVLVSDTESYSATVANPVPGTLITVPCVEYRIVYRNGKFYTIPEALNRVYRINQDAVTGAWYVNFTKTDELGQFYLLNDVESDLRVDVVVQSRTMGGLELSKTVTGPQADLTREFTFQVTFSDGGTYSYYGSRSGTLQSGGKLTLSHGQSVTFSGIPMGVSYSVRELEANKNGYVTTATRAVGTISAGTTVTAAFENRLTPPPPKTGDSMPIWVLTLLVLLCGGSLVWLYRKARRT